MLSKLTSAIFLTPLFAFMVTHGLGIANCPTSRDSLAHSSHPYAKPTYGIMNSTKLGKLRPGDPRVRSVTTTLRGKTYKYIVGEPQHQAPTDNVFLIHGFPDLGFGWRYQVPYLISQGFRVVVPDMLGYAETDSPADIREWSLKNIAADIKELAGQIVDVGQIILGGHDWGGAVVWRVALWHPKLIKAVFSICTPFSPPRETYVDLRDVIAAGNMTNFRYQLQFRGPEVEDAIQGEHQVRLFLNGMHGGVGSNGELGFSADKGGLLFDNLPKLGLPSSMTAGELNFYVQQYMRQKQPQLHGTLNWYRTAKINWEEELPLVNKSTSLEIPTLFISATRDSALPPSMSVGMEQYMPKLTRGEVQSSHWALTEASEDVNRQLGKWLSHVVKSAAKSAL